MEIDITLDEIVNFYLSQWELPDSQYGRIHSLAVRGYRQIYLHATGKPISVEIEVLANKTGVLPCDCLNKITLGVLNSLGEIASLTEDSNLGAGDLASNLRTSDVTQDILIPEDKENDIYYDQDGNFLTPFIFGQFGSGARSDLGFYKIDWESRTIVFDFAFSYSSVWMEYLPIYSNNGSYPVNPFFLEALLEFIGFQDPRRSANDRASAERRWGNQFRIGRRSMKPFDISQVFLQYARLTRQARY